MTEKTPPIVVMGVSGSGKTTIGAMLAEGLGREFIDGDSLHPAANKQKMGAGHSLNDADRKPWLEIIGQKLAASEAAGEPLVVACSALKRSYRDLIRFHEPRTLFVHLTGGEALLGERMAGRNHEFMPASLLTSQLATLEAPEHDELVLSADISLEPEQIVAHLLANLTQISL